MRKVHRSIPVPFLFLFFPCQKITSCQWFKKSMLTCYRVWSWHHEWGRCLWWVWNGSLRSVTCRWWCCCWCVGLLLLVCPGVDFSLCCCRTVGIFFSHRRAGVCPHTLCQAMAPAAPQTAILTPLQARATAVIILWRTSDRGWEEIKKKRKLEQAWEVSWGKEVVNMFLSVSQVRYWAVSDI